MEDHIVLYEKKFPPASPSPERNIQEALGLIEPEDMPEIPLQLTEVSPESEHFVKLAVQLSEFHHIDVSILHHGDSITAAYIFPEHCSFVCPYLSELKELILLADTAYIVPDYQAQSLTMVFLHEIAGTDI